MDFSPIINGKFNISLKPVKFAFVILVMIMICLKFK